MMLLVPFSLSVSPLVAGGIDENLGRSLPKQLLPNLIALAVHAKM